MANFADGGGHVAHVLRLQRTDAGDTEGRYICQVARIDHEAAVAQIGVKIIEFKIRI